MSNINQEAKKRYAKTATRINQDKLNQGIYKQFAVKGLAEDIDLIQAAIDKAGGSRVQALKAICQAYLNSETA